MLRRSNRTTIWGMACPEGSLDGLFLEGLGKAASYAISGSDLTITDSDEGTMQFVAAS